MAPLQYLSFRKVLMFYFVLLLFTSFLLLCVNTEAQDLQRRPLFGRRKMLEIDDEGEEEQLAPPIKKKSSTSLSSSSSSSSNGKLSKPSLSAKNQTKVAKPSSFSSKNQTKLSKSSDLEKEKSSIVKSQLKKVNSTSKGKASDLANSGSKKSSDLLKLGSAKNKTSKASSGLEKETKSLLKKKVGGDVEDSEKPKKKQSFSDEEEQPKKQLKKKQILTDEEEESEKPKKKKSFSDEEETKKPKKKQSLTDEEEEETSKPKKKKQNLTDDEEEAEKPKKKLKKTEEQEESEKPKKKQTLNSSTTQKQTTSKTSKESKPPQKKTQPIWVDQDEDDDIVSEFKDLHIKFQKTLIPDLERISTTSKAYLFKANKEITKGVKPYVGNKYAATIASFVSFAFIIIPLILVSLVFNRIKAYFSIQKIVIFIQIYLAIYFSILCLTSVVTGLEPLRFFYSTSRSTYVCLLVLQIFGYVLYLLLLLMYLILVFSTESGLGSKFLGLAQTFVGFAVGLHYYVAVFHRMVLHQPPKTNWKIHGIYATCFFAVCLLSGAERRKKAYVEEGGEEGKKN